MKNAVALTIVVGMSLAVTPTRTIAAEAAPPLPQALEQFEREVRPVLVKHCFECHGPKKEHNGLRLDSRAAVLKGGDSGPAVMPGKPDESLLIGAVKHESFEMPPEPSPPLSAKEIASLETWVRNGAPWPAEQNSAAAPQTIAERARKFWGFQPVRRTEPPAIANSAWSQDPVDRFLAARWEAAKLAPAADADPRTLIRRVTFVLTGLPPTAADVEAFVAACAPSAAAADQAYVALVDRLLASPRFGEHWARHWMDWVRYCDSHGSEGDPVIPEAWQYRDYLIRALNADVPYDQLVREHLAGDLLPQPRRNEALGINESIVGTAHLRFVEHGYQPVDPLEDLVKVTDNQIEVAMKSFQALTVTCARCHDHKFDAISQADFYALYPAFAAARPTQVQIDLPERLHRHDGRLLEIKRELKAKLAEAWLASLDELPARLRALPTVTKDEKGKTDGGSAPSPPAPLPRGERGDKVAADPNFTQYVQEAVDLTARRFEQPLFAWLQVRERSDKAAADTLEKLKQRYVDEARKRAELQKENLARRIVVDEAEFSKWRGTGAGMPKSTTDAGAWTVSVDEKRVVESVLPAGAYTHLLSTKHGAVLTSPTFKIEHDAVSVRISGGGYGTARLIVENYAVPRGGIYNLSSVPLEPGRQWYTWDTTFWRGFEARIELVTNDDLTIISRALPKDAPPHAGDGRSHIGISEIWLHHKKTPTAAEMEPRIAGAFVLKDFTAKSADDLARRYQTLARDAIAAWRDDRLSDDQAALLDGLVRAGVLPNAPAELPQGVADLAAEYRKLEAEIPIARRAPGVVETAGWDQPLLIRGDHKRPGDPVPRRYLEGLGSQSLTANTADPGAEGARLRLAELIASPTNPLTARVAANRLWHYVFGRGIVATVDNFGELGRRPTHPELLDFLAARFMDEGWSLKRAVRAMVLTRAFRLSSTPSAAAKKHDPENLLLSHASLRRLEAEAIRDSLVAVAGRLQQEPDQGPGFVHGEPPRLQTRRSVFVTVKRNSLPLFLETFDQPKPFTTIGARDVTNVPGQALTMLNDILVIELAQYWAKAQIERPTANIDERIRRMYVEAFAREPESEELAAAGAFVADLLQTHKVNEKDALSNVLVWQDFAHAMFNMKEFIYVR
ncbi:MAG: PSD1 domain-containing protein [Planctomycetes bacterium]|nr:PSD1 domain-containing protein [Planctomycetota bacterium]